MATRRIQIPWQTLHSDLTTGDGDFNVVTMYMPSADVVAVRVTFEVQNTTDASAVVKPGYNVANVENAPDAPALLPGAGLNSQTGDGVSFPTEKATMSVTKTQIRLGFFMKASAAGLKVCRVRGYIDIDDC